MVAAMLVGCAALPGLASAASVSYSAHSNSGSNGSALANAALVNYGASGSAYRRPHSGEGGSPQHAIDNNDRIDAVKITFSNSVRLTVVTFGWRDAGDTDFSVLYSTGGSPCLSRHDVVRRARELRGRQQLDPAEQLQLQRHWPEESVEHDCLRPQLAGRGLRRIRQQLRRQRRQQQRLRCRRRLLQAERRPVRGARSRTRHARAAWTRHCRSRSCEAQADADRSGRASQPARCSKTPAPAGVFVCGSSPSPRTPRGGKLEQCRCGSASSPPNTPRLPRPAASATSRRPSPATSPAAATTCAFSCRCTGRWNSPGSIVTRSISSQTCRCGSGRTNSATACRRRACRTPGSGSTSSTAPPSSTVRASIPTRPTSTCATWR